MEYVINVFLGGTVLGGAGGAMLSYLLRGWISERIKQSIAYEYSEKLESYKTDLNSKIESIRHDNKVSQLRTSLFFDHQRNAYAGIIALIAEINHEWMRGYDHEEGVFFDPVPLDKYKQMRRMINEHQLFLDDDCLIAMELTMDTYESSFPFDDQSGGPKHYHEALPLISFVDYLQPRIASIFKIKIGVESSLNHLKEVAILAAIKLLNNHHFRDIGIPPQGNLSLVRIENAADMVSVGERHFDEMLDLLMVFDEFLNRDGGWLPETQLKLKRCLNVLQKFKS